MDMRIKHEIKVKYLKQNLKSIRNISKRLKIFHFDCLLWQKSLVYGGEKSKDSFLNIVFWNYFLDYFANS